MPVIPGGDLTLLRTNPQRSNLYLIIQQPELQDGSGDWAGYLWACQVDGAPGGTAGDMKGLLAVKNGDAGPVSLLDSMTVFVGTTVGDHDKGIFRVRTDQDVGAATTQLKIGSSSEIVGVIEDNDWIVVLDEFRLWTRYPYVNFDLETEELVWYKDYGIWWEDLGATDVERRQASYPPVPIMGPHAVSFVDAGGSVDIDFDWRDSYAQYPGAAVDDWDAEGENGGAGWSVLNNSNPGAQTYSNISGLAGYRVVLEIGSDVKDPPAAFRRGVRYVFTLRRPGETQAGDPENAEPIVDFSLDSLSGDYDQGYWTGQITVFGSQASELLIVEGSLVVLFADDWYGSTNQSVAPKLGTTAETDDRQNIVFIGRIMDGTIVQDPETGNVQFEIASTAGVANNRDMYPVPIENDDAADEWFKAPGLTVDRAAWFYATWHTTMPLICDWNSAGDGSEEISAMDFLAGSMYSVIDSFLADRIFGRLLCDRFDRLQTETDRQLKAAASGADMYTLADTDWLDEFTIREVNETQASNVETGGLNYNDGLITPYLSRAPGDVNREKGNRETNTNMAVADQATLNTICGRWIASLNNKWPSLEINQGNWRIYDVWPQDYVIVSLETDRHTFSSDKFIQRGAEISYDPGSGSISVSPRLEKETDGVDGQTVVIPDELPRPVPPVLPYYPPADPIGDLRRRIASTQAGVIVTDNIFAGTPRWYAVNSGIPAGTYSLYCWKIVRDPWHWWTTGGADKTLWGIWGDESDGDDWPRYVYKHENFPRGTWTQVLDAWAIPGIGGDETAILDLVASIETEDVLYALVVEYTNWGVTWDKDIWWVKTTNGGTSWTVMGQVNSRVINGIPDQVPFTIGKAALAGHSGEQIAFVTLQVEGPPQAIVTQKTTDGGVTWMELGGYESFPGAGIDIIFGVTCPYIGAGWNDRDIISWVPGSDTETRNIRKSTNGGLTWSNIMPATWNAPGDFSVAPGYRNEYAAFTTGGGVTSPVYRSSDGGATWTEWADPSFLLEEGALFMWKGKQLDHILTSDRTNNRIVIIRQSSVIGATGNFFYISRGNWTHNILRDSIRGE